MKVAWLPAIVAEPATLVASAGSQLGSLYSVNVAFWPSSMKPSVNVAVSDTDPAASEPTPTEDGSANVATEGEAGSIESTSFWTPSSPPHSETLLLLASAGRTTPQ